MFFENAPYKENHFLDIYGDDDHLITAKGEAGLTP